MSPNGDMACCATIASSADRRERSGRHRLPRLRAGSRIRLARRQRLPKSRDWRKRCSGSSPAAARTEAGGMTGDFIRAYQVLAVCLRRPLTQEPWTQRGQDDQDQAGESSHYRSSMWPKAVRLSSATSMRQPRGRGHAKKEEINPMHSLPMHQALRCRAKSKRSRLQCRSPAMKAIRLSDAWGRWRGC
jgi:hypothetical protein